jgi:hypothetical protein
MDDPQAIVIRRMSDCCPMAGPRVHVSLIGQEGPLLDYSATSLADAIRYERETIFSLNECHCDLEVIIEDLSECPRCSRLLECLTTK